MKDIGSGVARATDWVMVGARDWKWEEVGQIWEKLARTGVVFGRVGLRG